MNLDARLRRRRACGLCRKGNATVKARVSWLGRVLDELRCEAAWDCAERVIKEGMGGPARWKQGAVCRFHG